MSSQLVGIADRYDRELAGVTDETLKRIFAAYDTSYRNLVKNLREAFPRLEQAGSISTLVRQGAIAAELGEALKFINPEAAKELERLGRDTIQQAGDLGQQMAGDALKYVGVQSTFTTVPVGAVRNQAERFRERLVNYSDQQASSISAVVEQGLIQGWGTRKIEGQLRGLGVSFKSNAETVARTETLSAYNGAARSRYEQAGVAYIQWIATPAEGTCSLCYARNTKVWKITEAPSIPAHPRCLPGDTLIFSPTIQGSASRQYTGQIVTIQTTSGKKLTATPNHPVFTDNGWIPLNQITEGDYVFSSIGAEDAVRLISPDNYQRPALISEVVRSFRESTGVGSVSMKVSPEYFHGDGEGSDVCVVSTNGLLRNDGYTETLEPFSHQHFIRRLVRALELLSPGLSAFLSPRQRPSLHSLMSVFNLPSPGGRIHSAPLNSLSLRLASDVHTSISQYQPDSGSLDAICLCESVFGLPLNISDNNQVPYISIGSTNSGFTGPVFEKLNLLLSALYSPPLNFAKQPLTVQPELSSSSLNRLSGKVKRDRVVNVRVSHFEGTVYNIETQTGWYFANSILTHNCRCTTLPVSSLDQIDTAFYESYSQDGLDDLARQKLQPDNGLTYWEKKAGATLAKPAWVPGQVIPKAEPLTANSLKWTRPANIPAKAKLQVVDIEQVWKDYQENGITLDLSDPATRARVDRLKADILNAVESGGKFTAPKLTFAKAGNEFNIPPGFDVTDGRHRITAFKELGFTSVKAYVDGDKPTAPAKPAAAKAQPQITPKPYMVNDMYAAEGKLIQRVKEHERAIYEINRSKETSFTVDGKTLTKQEALDLATAAMKKAKQEALKSSLDTLERLAQKKKNDPDNFGYAADIGESSGRDSQHDWLQPKLTAVPPAVEFNIKKQIITVDDNDGNYAEIKIVDPKVFAALYKKYQPIIQEMDVDARREINAESRLDDLARIQGTTREITQQRIQSIQEFSVFEYSGIRAADAGKTTFWDVEKDKERQVTDEHRQHARRINDYIENSPKYDGVVYRGFRQDTGDAGSYVEKIKAALKSDDGYSLRSVSSFSSDFEVAKEFAAKSGDGKKPPPEVFLIEVKRNTRGASIRSVSEIPMEAEVLVPNGTRYRYVGERVVIGSVANAALTTKGPTGRIVIYEVEEF